jgi:hypothetical protein
MNNLDASEILYAGWVAEECSDDSENGRTLATEGTEANVSVLHPL